MLIAHPPPISTTATRQRYRIAMVSDFFWPSLGGVENHIWSLAQHLIQLGHTVIVITHGYDDHSSNCKRRRGVRYLPGPLKVYYCPIRPMPGTNVAVPLFTSTFPLLRWILIREAIDIVHGHQATSTLASEAIVYAGLLGVKTIFTDHSLFGFQDVASVVLNRVIQTTLATVDAVICVSYTCRDNFVLRTTIEHAKVIPNAIIAEQFQPLSSIDWIEQKKRNNGRIKVVVLSRLVYRKGVDLLVGIIPAICKRLSYVDFIIGGDGSMMLNLQEMVERERLEERVEFLFSVPHTQVRDVMVQGDVFLNCSLTESFCIAILEAACCGLLVVSTNVGGVPEVLPDDLTILSDPNVRSMVGCLCRAIAQQSKHPIDTWKTHKRIQQMYSWGRVATETERVYTEISQHANRTFQERLIVYRSLGGITGFMVCYIYLLLEMLHLFLEMVYPRSMIDRVPDLCRCATTNIGKAPEDAQAQHKE